MRFFVLFICLMVFADKFNCSLISSDYLARKNIFFYRFPFRDAVVKNNNFFSLWFV